MLLHTPYCYNISSDSTPEIYNFIIQIPKNPAVDHDSYEQPFVVFKSGMFRYSG